MTRGASDRSSVGWPYRALYPAFRVANAILPRVHRSGVHRVPREGGAILAANHFTFYDPILIMVPLHRVVHWIAQELVLRGPEARRALFRSVGVIGVDRERGGNDAAVAEAARRVREGRVVGFFPEGRFARDPREPLPPRSGVGRVALATGAPVVPVALRTEKFWPYGAALPRPWEEAWVRFGEPLALPRDEDAARDPARAREAARLIWDRVLALRAELDADVERARRPPVDGGENRPKR